jgi:hypothetical protein
LQLTGLKSARNYRPVCWLRAPRVSQRKPATNAANANTPTPNTGSPGTLAQTSAKIDVPLYRRIETNAERRA